jgi:hypothetical protein
MVSRGQVQDPLEVFDSSDNIFPGTGSHFVVDQRPCPRSRPNGKFIRPIKGSPGAFIGVVEAPDETSALKAAIKEFGIVNPDQQKRLFVRRVSSNDD